MFLKFLSVVVLQRDRGRLIAQVLGEVGALTATGSVPDARLQ